MHSGQTAFGLSAALCSPRSLHGAVEGAGGYLQEVTLSIPFLRTPLPPSPSRQLVKRRVFRQPPSVNRQPPSVSRQPPSVNRQPPLVHRQPPLTVLPSPETTNPKGSFCFLLLSPPPEATEGGPGHCSAPPPGQQHDATGGQETPPRFCGPTHALPSPPADPLRPRLYFAERPVGYRSWPVGHRQPPFREEAMPHGRCLGHGMAVCWVECTRGTRGGGGREGMGTGVRTGQTNASPHGLQLGQVAEDGGRMPAGRAQPSPPSGPRQTTPRGGAPCAVRKVGYFGPLFPRWPR